MIPELHVLTLAGLLQVVQYVLMSVPANLELGPGKTMSARDPSRLGGRLEDQVSDRTGRLFRALNNHFEGLILFTLAVVVLVLGDKTSGLTAVLAWTYLGARILYVPAYWLGLRPWRSLIWAVGWLATVAMLLIALLT
ncbi:MAPEG family protein [Wenxinia marina]|uniref:MAPEG family n=1 Tax=Wenxinia marina DSM 24838 TaxID=1123501 RepID=A0A0D0QDQ3_9RHOB|nr:MAPEG family protein [Wenxinia marina]KIQ70482.1 MAPEG family [Wenxinia marina DSM 24838]GGL52770.1 membrane protein [Wenxinia marina]